MTACLKLVWKSYTGQIIKPVTIEKICQLLVLWKIASSATKSQLIYP